MKDSDCGWPATHDAHLWEHEGEILRCSGDPEPLDKKIRTDPLPETGDRYQGA